MCEHGMTTLVEVTIPANLSHKEVAYKKMSPIDSCIASIVDALEKGGVMMGGSCCGHGKSEGSIMLEDGRELVIRRIADELDN